MWSGKISTFIVKNYLKGVLIRKGLVGSLYMSMYLSKYINNVKLFFKDDAGDYKPIGRVAATLNNSVLYKTHISCDHTVKYFVCKQSEYFYGYVLSVLPIVEFVPFVVFSVISLRICNITNATNIKTRQKY